MAGQQHDETVAQQDVTSRETVVAEVVTKSRNKRDTANVALRATTRRYMLASAMVMLLIVLLLIFVHPPDTRDLKH